MPSIRSVGAT